MVRNPNRFLDVTTTTTTANGHHHHAAAASSQYSSSYSSSLVEYSRTLTTTISPLTLSPPAQPAYREESTRVQLQRQRLKEQHVNASRIPGFKTSAAFFASLRTNLRLSTSPPPSPMSTPPSMRASASSLPPPSPLATAEDSVDASSPAEDPLAGVPELKSYQATTEDDKIDALKLVADSIAQLRQKANSTLLRHPVNLAVLIAVTSIFARYLSVLGKDWIAVGMALSGALMVYFAAARLLTQQYIERAEKLNWAWLGNADVFVTKFGEEIIGALIIEWVSGETRTKRKKAWRGEIKGWAVRMKYRGKGVGTALLEDAVREAKSKGAESVEFADDHAAAIQVLPSFYNKPFETRERRSRELLQELFDNTTARKRK